MINKWKTLKERLIKQKEGYAARETDGGRILMPILKVLQGILDGMEELEQESQLLDTSHDFGHARCPACGAAFTFVPTDNNILR